VLVGECKWTEDRIDRQIARDLIEIKTPKLLADLAEETGEANWRAIPILFARNGFTPAAHADISHAGGLAVDLAALDADLTPG